MHWFAFALLGATIFHRPLFHGGVRLLLIQVAARQNLQVDVRLSGSILTNLTVDNLRAAPTGRAPNPVQRIAIEHLRLDYSLPRLVRQGVGEFLRSYEIVNAELEFQALPGTGQRERKQRRALSEDLNKLLGQPAAYADRVRIENFNVTVRATGNVTEVKGFDLLLDPQATGHLRVARLKIPGVPLWEKLSAETSYTGRNLLIKHLVLAPELVLNAVNFDASQRRQHRGRMDLRASVFGGSLHLALHGDQLDRKGENRRRSYDTTLRIEAAGISLAAASAYFGVPRSPAARLTSLDVLFTGEPERPRTWSGRAAVRAEALTFGRSLIDGVEFAATFQNGRAEVTGINIAAGRNAVVLSANAVLPESAGDFPLSEVDARLRIDAPDLASPTAMLPDPFTGAISGRGPLRLRNGRLHAELTLDARTISNRTLTIHDAKFHLTAEKRIAPSGSHPFADLAGRITAAVSGVRAGDFTIDASKLDVEIRNDLVTLHAAEVQRAENSVHATGTYRIPADMNQAAKAPIDAKFAVQFPRIESFGLRLKDHILSGRLAGQGALKVADNLINGHLEIDGGDFRLGEFTSGPLTVKVRIKDSIAAVDQLTLQLGGKDHLGATGEVELRTPFPYAGALLLDIGNLAVLQPLLTSFGATQTLAGALHLDWAGKGEAAMIKPPWAPSLGHSGKLDFALAKGRFDKIDLSEIRLAGLYGPGFAQSSELRFVSGPASFTGNLEFREGKMRLKDMSLAQHDLTVLTGFLILPFDLDRLKQPIPLDQRIAANINATNLDLDKLLGSFGQVSPVSGSITANVVTGGTLLRPLGHLKFAGRKLRAKAVAALDPADLDLDLHYSNKELTLDATARQPQMQPLAIKGRVPFDLEATVKSGKLDPALPLDVAVRLPPSPLAIVPKLTPQVRTIEGTLGLDLRVAGSVEKPLISGNAALDLAHARMDNPNVPAIRGFKARMTFADDTLRFEAFEGEVGGGTFKLGGSVKVPKLTEPVFDLRMQSDDVLVMRNDSITVRADTDVTFTGPLAAASVGGTVFITHSRFFKEIDILPIALPGKAKPVPKTARTMDAGISFPNAPLRDMKFDLAIKTRPDDAFLIRGNLANGAAALDLRLAGTGLAPYLDGSIRVMEFRASLPFSTLSVTRGFIYFSQDAPFQPSLELQADSQTRDYLVHAYIYGKAADPQIQLTSEPPLPYSDIVSLLATGVTAGELTGNADVLASKAAMLAVQQLYRKIFLRNKAPAVDAEKTGDGEFLDRFKIELGALDNRTGSQQVTSRVRLTDQLYLTGDIGTEGGFTGRLKYLIRFR